jgi:hypothetical protein
VCQLLYIIIFEPYNLFKLFLVHKISVYKYIYENGKRKWKKKKEKGFSASWAGGNFGPASAGAGRRPSRPTVERRGVGGRHGRGPTRQREEGGNDVERAKEGGPNRSGSTAGEVRGGSPPGARFCDGGVVARHGRG